MSFNECLIAEENRILSYTFEDLKPLFELIPKIKNAKNFREYDFIKEFQQLACDTKVIINFDWANWSEGNEIVETSNTDFSSLDKVSICKLITAVIQSEAYIDNGLIDYFEEEIILELLESLKDKFSN